MKEEWRDIKGYESLYQVSNLGRIKSLKNNRDNYREKILKVVQRGKHGYLGIGLHKNGKSKSFYIHRLVAEAFIPNPNNYKEVNHKDENKQNNRVENLEWCTREYNNRYGTRNQRQSESHKGVVSNKRKVQCVTTGKIFNTIKEASKYYFISIPSITMCCRGKTKSAGKHPDTGEKLIWKYID